VLRDDTEQDHWTVQAWAPVQGKGTCRWERQEDDVQARDCAGDAGRKDDVVEAPRPDRRHLLRTKRKRRLHFTRHGQTPAGCRQWRILLLDSTSRRCVRELPLDLPRDLHESLAAVLPRHEIGVRGTKTIVLVAAVTSSAQRECWHLR